MLTNRITDIAGLRVGHATDLRRASGVTALLFDEPVVAGVDVRGGGPGTRETDLLDPERSVERIDALVLSGGSAFGLDAAVGAAVVFDRTTLSFGAVPSGRGKAGSTTVTVTNVSDGTVDSAVTIGL